MEDDRYQNMHPRLRNELNKVLKTSCKNKWKIHFGQI